jgi:hypothetical protein
MRILGVVSLHWTYPLKIKKIDNPLSREFESIYKTASTIFLFYFFANFSLKKHTAGYISFHVIL